MTTDLFILITPGIVIITTTTTTTATTTTTIVIYYCYCLLLVLLLNWYYYCYGFKIAAVLGAWKSLKLHVKDSETLAAGWCSLLLFAVFILISTYY